MKRPAHSESKPMQAVRKIALRFPETEEGISCNKAAFKAGKKAFLFMGMDEGAYHLMLKLGDSLAEARKFAAKEPERYSVGGTGWVSMNFPHEKSPPAGLMERWLEESYRLLVPKRVAAKLAERRG